MITLRPAVVTASTTASWRSLPAVHRGAEAGEHQQRVVDPDADPDQPGHGGRPVGHVDDVGQQRDQAAGGDAEPDQGDRERQAGGDDRAERDQQHDRGAEEPDALGAGLRLRGVDRIAAELDLRGRRRCCRRRRRSAARRSPWARPSRATVIGSVVAPIVPSFETRIGVCGRDVRRPSRASAKNASRRSCAAGLCGAGRVLPDDVDLLPGVAAEALLGEVARGLRLRSRGVVVGVVVARRARSRAR